MTIGHLHLLDMLVVGAPPAKLMKALAVIAEALHAGFDQHPTIPGGKSKESCILCALTVRDFLRAIGIPAQVRPVFAVMWAHEHGKQLHSLGIGKPGDNSPEQQKIAGRWHGHLVVTAEGFLIDPTLYPAIRSHWPDLTGMATLPLNDDATYKIYDLDVITGATLTDPDDRPTYAFNLAWLDTPANTSWRIGPDARQNLRRRPVVKRMVKRFGRWEARAA